MNQEEVDKLNRRVTRGDVEYVIKKKKIPYKQKSGTRWLHRQILPNICRRTYINSSQTLPKY